MAALSNAESPPPVFNGDTMDRDPERERGLEELGACLDPACSVGIPECPQDEEVWTGETGVKLGMATRGYRVDVAGWGSLGNTGCNMDRGDALQGAR